MSEDMRRELNNLKKTVEATNAAVAGLRTAASETNAAVARLDATVTGVAATLERTNAMLNRTMISVAQLTGTAAELKETSYTTMAAKEDFSKLNERMDGFAGLLIESRHRWAVHADTLVAHDARLKKLEAPGS